MVLAQVSRELSVDPSGNAEDLASRAGADGVEFILAVFVDLTGKPCAKLVPIEAVEELADGRCRFRRLRRRGDGPAAQGPRRDRRSPTPPPTPRCPSSSPGLALVHCDPHVEGAPWPSRRGSSSKSSCAAPTSCGLSLFVGAEVEYFLVDREPGGGLRAADAKDTARAPCYDARGLTRMYDHLTAVSRAMNVPGLGKQRQRPRGRQRAVRAELRVTPTPSPRPTGSITLPLPALDARGAARHDRDLHAQALHRSHRQRAAHAPVAVARRRAQPSPRPPDSDERGLGLSPLAYAFVAGMLDHAPALQAVIAPTVNSYKRTGADRPRPARPGPRTTPATAATTAPTCCGFRTRNRVELRGGDGSANPYLAAAAALAAGLDGIERDLDPGTPGAAAGTRPGGRRCR